MSTPPLPTAITLPRVTLPVMILVKQSLFLWQLLMAETFKYSIKSVTHQQGVCLVNVDFLCIILAFEVPP